MNGAPRTIKELGIYVYGKMELLDEQVKNLHDKLDDHIENCPTKIKVQEIEKKESKNRSWIKWAVTTVVALGAAAFNYFKTHGGK